MPALVREISATIAEYRHGVRLAFPGQVSEDTDGLRVEYRCATLEIRLEPLPPRVIALLRLPVLRAELRFTSGTPAQQAGLLARLDLATQRGGG